jgi:hypothetical protein
MTEYDWLQRVHGENNQSLRGRLTQLLREFAEVIENTEDIDARLSALNIGRILLGLPEMTDEQIKLFIDGTEESGATIPK